MNQTIEAICGRTSVRQFSEKSVDKSYVNELLKAAMSAPSACNQQIWRFVVLDDKAVLEKLSSMHSGIKFLKDAALAVLVCGEPGAAVLDYYWEDDCAAATQNMLLAAHALGLGATWSGVNRKDSEMTGFIRKAVNMPEQYIPFSLAVIGYPRKEQHAESRFDKTKIHHNGWGLEWAE